MEGPIDTELSGLCEAVREDLLRKEDRSRQRRRVDAARELDLKPGTDLGGLFRRFEELSVEDRAGFELLIGAQMLQYCLSTRAGNLLGVVAAAEGKDPYEVVANLIARHRLLCSRRYPERRQGTGPQSWHGARAIYCATSSLPPFMRNAVLRTHRKRIRVSFPDSPSAALCGR